MTEKSLAPSAENTGALLRLVNVAVATRTGHQLYSGLNLQLHPGQLLTVTGPNGVGKSTLLQVILGGQPQAAGQVQLNVPTNRIAFLPQLHNQACALPLELRDVIALSGRGYTETKALATGLLTRADFTRSWNQASGGERQKTLLIRALLEDPRLLILDEPLNHLDEAGAQQLVHVLRHWVKERDSSGATRAVLLVSHPQKWFLVENSRSPASAYPLYTKAEQLIDLKEFS